MNWFTQNIEVIIGAALGTLAHFGNQLIEGESPRLIYVVGYLMQLGLIIVIATTITEAMEIQNDTYKVGVGGTLALAAQEIIKFTKERGWKRLLRPWLDEIDGEPAPKKDSK